jgi:hypothetical protein
MPIPSATQSASSPESQPVSHLGIKHKNPKRMQVIQKAIFTNKSAQLSNRNLGCLDD